MLRKIDKYNIFHRYDHLFNSIMTLNILENFIARKISNFFDILTIAVNACQYDKRIEMKRFFHSHHSFSLAILKFLAINDEFLKNDRKFSEKFCKNVSKFFKHQIFEIDFSVNINI